MRMICVCVCVRVCVCGGGRKGWEEKERESRSRREVLGRQQVLPLISVDANEHEETNDLPP